MEQLRLQQSYSQEPSVAATQYSPEKTAKKEKEEQKIDPLFSGWKMTQVYSNVSLTSKIA